MPLGFLPLINDAAIAGVAYAAMGQSGSTEVLYCAPPSGSTSPWRLLWVHHRGRNSTVNSPPS